MSVPSGVQQVVGRALTDPEFRRSLVRDTRGTLERAGFQFDEPTLAAIEAAVRDPDKVWAFSANFQTEFLGRAEYVA